MVEKINSSDEINNEFEKQSFSLVSTIKYINEIFYKRFGIAFD